MNKSTKKGKEENKKLVKQRKHDECETEKIRGKSRKFDVRVCVCVRFHMRRRKTRG